MFRGIISLLSLLVLLGTFCDFGKLFIEFYEKKYVANTFSDDDCSTNADEKLRLIKNHREKGKREKSLIYSFKFESIFGIHQF